MIFDQILPTSNIRYMRRIARRMWMLILGLKGLMGQQDECNTAESVGLSVAEGKTACITRTKVQN